MPMFWRFYFWAYLGLSALGVIGAALRPDSLSPTDWIDLAAFTPVAILAAGAQTFNRALLPTTVWRVALFTSVFWKSIALGISVPKVVARGVDLNARMGLGAAEVAIVIAIGVAAFLTGPPLVALYHKAYPDGDLGRMRVSGPKAGRSMAAKA